MKTPCHIPEQTQRKRRGKSTQVPTVYIFSCSLPTNEKRNRQVAQLEAKLDGLVNMIAAQQKHTPPDPIVITPESQSSYSRGVTMTTRERLATLPVQPETPDPDPSTLLTLMPEFQVTVTMAAVYLDRYRNEYMPKYPFVILSSEITACELYREKPALFWAIMASVAPVDGPTAAKLRVWFREYFSTQVFIEQQKTTTLIQAILVYVSWYVFPSADLSSLVRGGIINRC